MSRITGLATEANEAGRDGIMAISAVSCNFGSGTSEDATNRAARYHGRSRSAPVDIRLE
jgi:hypothetical protein